MKYDKKIVERICELVRMDSYTIPEICRQVGISKSTYHEWESKKPEFSDCIKKARNDFDELVAKEATRSLMKKICGYTVQEIKTFSVAIGRADDGKPILTEKERTVTDKHFQPDTAAIIFALTNREPERWKNRRDTDITTGGEKVEFKGFSFLPYTPEEE
jgi:transcriptional regulator with XRE-family HTH domain